MRSFSCVDASVGLSDQGEKSCNPTTYRSTYDSPLAYKLLIGLNSIVVCLAFFIYSFCARGYDIECGEGRQDNYLQLALNGFRNKIKGNDIKWIKRSVVHRKVLEDLVKKLKYKPHTVKTIGVYKVCFEDHFRIGCGSNGTEVFVGLGTDGVEVAIKRLKSDFSYLGENEKNMMNSQRLKDNPNVLTYRFHTEGRQYVYLITNLEEESLNQFVRSTARSLDELQKKGPTILKQILL
ncbi:Hypothetical predicted protein, partial [Paramuricea clavata]